MTAWAQLLHFYQPPTQRHDVLQRIAEESYRPLLQVLKEHRSARVAVNMNAVLTEMLAEHGLGDIVKSLQALGERGQVEFVGSGQFHPILPLIPADERERSIAGNAATNARLLDGAWRPAGFFPPEMCFSMEIVPAVEASGHEWLVLSGVACPAPWPTDRVLRIAGSELAVLFRDDGRSNRISFRETDPAHFLEDIAHVGGGKDAYVVTAMDAETYGHHIRGWEREFLAATYTLIEHQGRARPADRSASRVRMAQPGELVDQFPAGEAIVPYSSSWSTTEDDLRHGNPFPLWHAPGNRVHDLQWQYVRHCIDLSGTAARFATEGESRKFAAMAGHALEPALHSCQFWWASRRPMWDVPMIHRGFLLLNDVVLYASRSVHLGSAPPNVKEETSWRVAAANEARARLERHLFADEVL